jgi:hypothetical protein
MGVEVRDGAGGDPRLLVELLGQRRGGGMHVVVADAVRALVAAPAGLEEPVVIVLQPLRLPRRVEAGDNPPLLTQLRVLEAVQQARLPRRE